MQSPEVCEVIKYADFIKAYEAHVTEITLYYWEQRGCPEEVDWPRAEQKVEQELLTEMVLGLPC
jgi:hypothetical protein